MQLPQILSDLIPTIQIVDVGAMETGQDRYHPLVTEGLAHVTGFEPNEEECRRLQERPGPYRFLPVFLGNGEPATFHRTGYPGCSSLLAPDANVIDLFMTMGCAEPDGNFHVQGTEPVKTVRLDDLGPDIVIDFLKIDVQGHELEVMRGGTGKLANAVVIEVEAEFIPLYAGQPLFGDLQCFLRDQGFVLHKMIDLGGRPFRPFTPPNPFLPMSQLIWADAIFVRNFTRLDTYTNDQLLKAVAIVDLVYGSFDLAGLLLREYDRRSNTDLFESYFESLRQRKLRGQFMNILDRPN